MMFQRRLPLPFWLVAIVCVLYAFVGVLTHDPWKTADAVNLSTAKSIAFKGGTTAEALMLPRVAGSTPANKPPLYFWVSAATARAASAVAGADAWVAGARSASALFVLIGLMAISLASRGFYGEEAGLVAPLIAIGTLGLIVPAHDAQPITIAFAAFGLVMAALAWWEVKPIMAGSAIGISALIASAGVGMGATWVVASIVMIAVCFARWRRVAPMAWALAAIISLFGLLLWPALLLKVNADAFAAWWTWQTEPNTRALLDAKRMQVLAWGGWPALPLAAWSVWVNRATLLAGRHVIPVATFAAAGALFLYSAEPFEGIVPLVAPLAVLGSAGAGRLRRGAANAFDWFAGITITLILAIVWVAGIAIQTGEPARIAKNFTKPAPGFVADFSLLNWSIAAIVAVTWVAMIFLLPKSPWRATTRWATGMLCTWLTIGALVLPWADYSKTYRLVSADLRLALRNDRGCIAADGVGIGQLAAFDVLDDIRTEPGDRTTRCPWLLRQAYPGSPTGTPGWQLIVESARPGDRTEVYRLYRRSAAPSP